MSLALVTGATGIVGKPLVRHLIAEGWRVRALARSAAAIEQVQILGAEPVLGDVLDAPALRAAAEGCDTVFHVAGLNAYCQRDPAALIRVNVTGSLLALRAAEVAGVRRFVLTSSAATIGEATGTLGREDSPHRGFFLTDYERAKYEAEVSVLSEPTPVEVVVVNPASVQGPGRLTGTGKVILDLARGRQRLMTDGRLSLVDVDDCARGHLLAAQRGTSGQRYILSSFNLANRDLAALMAELSGRERKLLWVPPNWLTPIAALSGAAAAAFGRTPLLCPETARNLRHGAVYDAGRSERELGLQYSRPRETLGRLMDWYRAEGLVG